MNTKLKQHLRISLASLAFTLFSCTLKETKYQKTYLIFDHGGVLDGHVTQTPPSDKDIVIAKIDTGLYQVLQNGIQISQQLSALVTNHNYEIVFHSKCKEAEQMHILAILQNSCIQKGISFPKVLAMAARDEKVFQGRTSDNPAIIKDRPHGIWIAGYDKELDGKACVRAALSRLLNISELDRSKHIIFDDGPSVIAKAKVEGWQTREISGGTTLDKAIDDIYKAELVKSKSAIIYYSCTQSTKNKNKWVGKSYLKKYNDFELNTSSVTLRTQATIHENSIFFLEEITSDIKQSHSHPISQYKNQINTLDLDKDFFENYRKQPKDRYSKVQNLPIKGLGRALAIAMSLYDSNYISNYGFKMSYISKGQYFEIVKINGIETLPFIKKPEDSKIQYKKSSTIAYQDLKIPDQEEFILTTEKILMLRDEKFLSIFKPLIRADARFQSVAEQLLQRKNLFIKSLSPDVKQQLYLRIQTFATQKGESLQTLFKNNSLKTKCLKKYNDIDQKYKDILKNSQNYIGLLWDTKADEERYKFLQKNNLLYLTYDLLKPEFKQYLSSTTQSQRHQMWSHGKHPSTEDFWNQNLDLHLQWIVNMNRNVE